MSNAEVGHRVETGGLVAADAGGERDVRRTEHLGQPRVDHRGGSASLPGGKHLASAKDGEHRHTHTAHVNAAGPEEQLASSPILPRREGGDPHPQTPPAALDRAERRVEELARRTRRHPERDEGRVGGICGGERLAERGDAGGRLRHVADTIASDRDQAIALLYEWVQGEGLRRHALAVEAAMRAYAADLGENADVWGCVGLLHDFDWERHPTLDQHPQDGEPVLAAVGYPDWFRRAILSHAEHLHLARETPLERHLYACDELSGFVHACALVRPQGLEGLEPKSVRKKLKQPSFASGVNRDDVVHGAEEIERDLDDHIRFVVAALRPIAGALGVGEGAGSTS